MSKELLSPNHGQDVNESRDEVMRYPMIFDPNNYASPPCRIIEPFINDQFDQTIGLIAIPYTIPDEIAQYYLPELIQQTLENTGNAHQ